MSPGSATSRPTPPEFEVLEKGVAGGQVPAVYLRLEAILDILHHVPQSARHELGGLLAGEAAEDAEGAFVLVERALASPSENRTSVSVTFTPEDWDALWEARDRECPGKRIVGWYHTHPGLRVFLSEQDRFIHRHFFTEAFQLALVVDPVRSEWGVFRWEGQEVLSLAGGFYVYGPSSAGEELEEAWRQMDPAWAIRLV